MPLGITYAKIELSNPRAPQCEPVQLEMLVDSGAFYSVVPAAVLASLEVSEMERESFTLADGSHREYPVGEAFFVHEGKGRTSQVVFGPEGATPLLGALTLESLGLMLNPVTRELLPMRLVLAALRAAA